MKQRRGACAAALLSSLVRRPSGPFADIAVNDLFVYTRYAELLATGRLPYLDFAFEYPPLAALPLWLANVPGGGEDGYAWAFGALMLACALALQWLAGGARRPARPAWLLVLLPVAHRRVAAHALRPAAGRDPRWPRCCSSPATRPVAGVRAARRSGR